ncbi:MAG: flippase-like domain-containing protein [Candidatus Eisenbacteria bacterium]|uniref:Flippase-like domain-containing protein n=1 Tax=Eiseniibacteriota bacterium TaxID=2212470 RepID=A0A538T7Y1_UNCEI|nr:MAG: flippase-like domain-containing protein [Candidatus Eisenbacteria bacterium]
MTGATSGVFRKLKLPLIALKIMLSFALFAYVIAKVSPRNVWVTMKHADPKLLAAAAGLFLVSSLIGSWLWARLLRAQGVSIPYAKAASYYFVGLFFNNFLPSNIGGDIARISDAAKHADHVSPVFSATVMDRLIGILAIGLLAVVASVAVIDRLHLYAIYWAILIVFLVAAAFFASIFNRNILEAFERPFRAIGARKIERGIARLMDDLHGFRSERGALLAAFAASTLVQISRIYVHSLVGLALGVRISLAYYFLFVPVLAALISLPISLNGIGVREGAAVVLFRLAGLTREEAFSIPFLTYILSVLISLLGGLIFISRPPRRALGKHLQRRKLARTGGGGASPGEGRA